MCFRNLFSLSFWDHRPISLIPILRKSSLLYYFCRQLRLPAVTHRSLSARSLIPTKVTISRPLPAARFRLWLPSPADPPPVFLNAVPAERSAVARAAALSTLYVVMYFYLIQTYSNLFGLGSALGSAVVSCMRVLFSSCTSCFTDMPMVMPTRIFHKKLIRCKVQKVIGDVSKTDI